MSSFSDIVCYLRIYRTYLGQRMYAVFVLTALTTLAEGFGITLLLPLLKMMSAAAPEAPSGRVERYVYDVLEWLGIAQSMVGLLLFIGVAFLVKGLFKFVEGGYRGYLYARLVQELKVRLFDAYRNMSYGYYSDRNTGHFINVINQQVHLFLASFQSFAGFLSQAIQMVIYFLIAFYLSWGFTVMALGVGVGILFLFRYLNAYVRDLSRKTSREMSHLNRMLVQVLQAFKYITSTDRWGHLRSDVVRSVGRFREYTFRQRVAQAFTGAIKEPISVAFIIAIIILQLTVLNQPLAPIFVSVLLFHRGLQAVIGVQERWQETMSRVGGVEMVNEEYQRASEHAEREGNRELEAFREEIRLEDVSFSYDEEAGPVLQNLSLTISSNTTVAFVGASGAGKSTLVDVLTLLLKPQAGTLTIDGVPGEAIALASWRSQLGYVSQEDVVFDDTIANNISLWSDEGASSAVRQRVHEAAEKAYAASFIEGLPDGYDTKVGDRGIRLSGGQRQRLFIARELFKEPRVLILDEATSALDTKSERVIQQSIDALKRSVTVVIIAHRLSTIKNVDRIYLVEGGRIVEEGTYDELMSIQATHFREMVEMQNL